MASATVDFRLEPWYILFQKRFILVTNLTSPPIGLIFLHRNSTILIMSQGETVFYSSMQLKPADNRYSSNNRPLLNPTEILMQPGEQTVIYLKTQSVTKNEVSDLIRTSPDQKDNDDLIMYPALTTTQNRQVTVLINNFVENSHRVKKENYIATIWLLTPEPAKCMKPVNPTLLRRLLDTNHSVHKRNVDEAKLWRLWWHILVSHTSRTRWWNLKHTNTQTYTPSIDSFIKTWTTKPTKHPGITWPIFVKLQLEWLNIGQPGMSSDWGISRSVPGHIRKAQVRYRHQ